MLPRSERARRPGAAPLAALIAAVALSALATIGSSAQAQESSPPSMGPGDSSAPSDRASPTIEFPHLPHLVVEAIPSYGPAPLTVGFLVSNANPESSPFVSYRWTFGDGQFSTLPPIFFFHTYPNPGSYVIEVTATTSDGLNSTGVAGVVVH